MPMIGLTGIICLLIKNTFYVYINYNDNIVYIFWLFDIISNKKALLHGTLIVNLFMYPNKDYIFFTSRP